MNFLKALFNIFNGQKLNTGTVVIIASIVIDRFLSVGHEQAVSIATSIMTGAGGIIALIGYIHKIIKAKAKAK